MEIVIASYSCCSGLIANVTALRTLQQPFEPMLPTPGNKQHSRTPSPICQAGQPYQETLSPQICQ
jgi:hypothetical protein